ncbi:MAG: tetratricopeptide repeat protein [Ignavibacteria bacterium]
MRGSTENTFSKKVKLIYEYNKNSPLFVKAASSEISENNIDNALEILLPGLKTYPDHPVAHLLLGKAYALMGKYNEAQEYFKKGSDLISSKETYDHYLNELNLIRKQRSLFEVSKGNSFFNSSRNNKNLKSDPNLFNEAKKNGEEKFNSATIDERLSQLAEEISKAKISSTYNGSLTDSDFEGILAEDNLLVSETLAEIYLSQNEYDEAINVYKKLIVKKPGAAARYEERIDEIKSKNKS